MDKVTNSSSSNSRCVVLASTSPYRRLLLARLRIPFDAMDSRVDEDAYKGKGLAPDRLVRELAEAKARAVGALRSEALIVAGDQMAVLDGRMLGKPGSIDGCVQQLGMLAGRTHQLITALCVLDATSGASETVVDVHDMTMRRLEDEQIRRYVDLDEPLDCAGSYKLECFGVALFERVAGRDPTAIVGMPLMQLVTLLMRMGYDVFAHAS
jgi:septum formation protein